MLSNKRQAIIDYVKANADFLNQNKEALEIYDGNLRPYVDAILQSSLSQTYYNAIKDRVILINILQKYVNKISNTYSKPPRRECEDESLSQFLEFYEDEFEINNEGAIADTYSNLFKGFAWEPFINDKGEPCLRTIPYDRFLVMSDSKVNPEEENIFIKIMGKKGQDSDSILLFVYTDLEFDAFYLNGAEASEYLLDNQGQNLIGTIPFVYGKRQKNRLVPMLDSDMLSMAKTISVQLSDSAGAQMFSSFPILYGIDVNAENMKLSPNAFWSMKSDKDSDKKPEVGVLQPTSDSQKVMEFIVNTFVLWLETKGIRVGSMGSLSSGNMASGISKIIDEMDSFEILKKSMEWFKHDEEELWCDKLPKIHNYWIKSGLVDASKFPSLIANTDEIEIEVEFETPTPMLSRAEELANVKSELEMGTMSLESAIKILHPDYSEDLVSEIIESGAGINGVLIKSQAQIIANENKTEIKGEKISLEKNPLDS